MAEYYAVVHRKLIMDDFGFVAIGSWVVDLPNRDVVIAYNTKYLDKRDHMMEVFAGLSGEQWTYDCCLDYWKHQGGQDEAYTEPQLIEADNIEEAARIITDRVDAEWREYWSMVKEKMKRDGVLVYRAI